MYLPSNGANFVSNPENSPISTFLNLLVSVIKLSASFSPNSLTNSSYVNIFLFGPVLKDLLRLSIYCNP